MEKENFFRNRFHSRGLSDKYSSSSSNSMECNRSPYPKIPAASTISHSSAHLKPRNILGECESRNILGECQSQIGNSSSDVQSYMVNKYVEEEVDNDRLNWSRSAETTPSCARNAPHEIVGTPTVTLRKGLLDRNHVDLHRDDRKLSPSLQRLISAPSLEKIKSAVKNQLENGQLGKSFTLQTDRESPGLTRLRQTPGKPLREKQQTIADKHDETRRHADTVNVGGGVSLWPGMANMRLTKRESIRLIFMSVFLVIVVFYTFATVHGKTLSELKNQYLEVKSFRVSHAINASATHSLTQTSLQWHRDFSHLVEEIELSFVMPADDSNFPYVFYTCCLLYVAGVATLLYYLADNVMSSSKLSPNRIKKWVCLLCVVGSWTLNMITLCYAAFLLEKCVEDNVLWLSEQQKEMVYKPLDMHTYDQVLRYWTVKCLSSSSSGVIRILGIFQFNSLIHYIQYYSLPIITALISPIVKLVLSLLHVYGLIDCSAEL